MLRARARNRAGVTARALGLRLGLDVRRHQPFAPRRAAVLAERGIELALDVGANRGQYAEELRAHGFGGRIVSFEPSSAASAELLGRAAGDPGWEVRRLALADAGGEVELGRADNFSSVLPVGGRLGRLFPDAVPRGTEQVPAARLDALGLELPAAGRTLLKLDVQGYELRVLAGATGVLPAIGVVETELSIVPLYGGQPLLADVVRALDDAGFALRALEPILRDRRTGELLQADGLFVRARR
jgi:FkbM family methyltransferase